MKKYTISTREMLIRRKHDTSYHVAAEIIFRILYMVCYILVRLGFKPKLKKRFLEFNIDDMFILLHTNGE